MYECTCISEISTVFVLYLCYLSCYIKVHVLVHSYTLMNVQCICVTWKADGRGFKSHPRQPIFLFGRVCCVALPFCCVVVALPFSASLRVIVHVHCICIVD